MPPETVSPGEPPAPAGQGLDPSPGGARRPAGPVPRAVYRRRRLTILAAVVLVIGLVVAGLTHGGGAHGPGASTTPVAARTWSGWLRAVNPVLVHFDHDYGTTGHDLGQPNDARVPGDFRALAADAAALARAADSGVPSVNADLDAMASDVARIAQLGETQWPSLDPHQFRSATEAYLTASRTLTNAILARDARQ